MVEVAPTFFFGQRTFAMMRTRRKYIRLVSAFGYHPPPEIMHESEAFGTARLHQDEQSARGHFFPKRLDYQLPFRSRAKFFQHVTAVNDVELWRVKSFRKRRNPLLIGFLQILICLWFWRELLLCLCLMLSVFLVFSLELQARKQIFEPL